MVNPTKQDRLTRCLALALVLSIPSLAGPVLGQPNGPPVIASVEFSPRATDDVGLDAFLGQYVSFEVVIDSDGGTPIISYYWYLTYPDIPGGSSVWSTVTATTGYQFIHGGAYMLNVVVANSGGYLSDPMSPTNALGTDEPIDIGSAAAPAIVAFIADDPDNGDNVYGDGDVLLVQFNVATDRAGFGTAVLSKTEVDGLFYCDRPLGLDYEGAWTADDELTITILTAVEPFLAPIIGLTRIAALASGQIRVAGGESLPSSNFSPPLSGNYGEQPSSAGAITPPTPDGYALLEPFPNPFNPRTTVWLDIPRSGGVTLAVHDLRGRLVRTLLSGQMSEGRHPVVWDGMDDRGAQAPSGVYLVRLVTADGAQRAVKVTLSK